MRICLSTIILACLIGFPCFAQSNDKVDELLTQVQVRTDAAAYIVLNAGGWVDENASADEAYAMALEKKWLPQRRAASEPIELDELCALTMSSLGLKGGLMYGIFPGPRYAYHELVAKGIVNSSGGPHRYVPGDEVLTILSESMALRGGEQ